ncbi:MAG: MoxR family ATPase [Candidatus Jordarchaeales archaeon]
MSSEVLREKVLEVINTVESHGLFVHDELLTVRCEGEHGNEMWSMPLVVTLAVLNALVPRGAMLLYGGHGGGKTTLAKVLGRMMTGAHLSEIEEAVVRGHPQLTEEKMIATLKPGRLLRDGVEEVVWRKFVTSFWKIVDEINRLTPYTQNILLSLLAEGRVKFYDAVYECGSFVLYATMNPQDPGTFEVGLPLLDRFGIAVPITMPSVTEIPFILSGQDERLYGYDPYYQVPQVLSVEELRSIWRLVDATPVDEEAKLFVGNLISEFSACERASKENVTLLRTDSGLCDGCHFNVEKSVCNKVVTPLSVRAAKDILRYSKALSWLLGAEKVTVDMVVAIAPYAVWHRVKYPERLLMEPPYYGDQLKFTFDVMKLVMERFVARRKALEIFEKFKMGEGGEGALKNLEEWGRSDLVVKTELVPKARHFATREYRSVMEKIRKALRVDNVRELEKVRNVILSERGLPNRFEILRKLEEAIHEKTKKIYMVPFREWGAVYGKLAVKFPELQEPLKQTFKPPVSKCIKHRELTIIVHATGGSDEDPVFVEIAGGKADEVAKIVEEVCGSDNKEE